MDSIDSQLALADNIEFEEKVDIETLVFPSKPMNSENPMMDLSQKRSLKIRQSIETIGEYDECGNQKLQEIVSLKAKIVEVTEKHKIAMSLNAKNMHSVFKLHEKVLDDKPNEIMKIKQELQRVLVTNQELLQEIQEFKTNKNTASLESNLKIKPFSCKICDKAFHQIHEVKEHIKIHDPISEVEVLRNQVKYLKTQVSQCKLASGTRQKNELIGKVRNKTETNLGKRKKRKASAVSAQPDSELAPKVAKKNQNKTCPICQAVFSKPSNCKQHIAKVHEEKRPFECNECANKFKDKSTLDTHMKGIHMNKQPYSCKICTRGFNRKSRLLKHESKCARKENMFE